MKQSYYTMASNPLEKYRAAEFGVEMDRVRKEDARAFWHKYYHQFKPRVCPACNGHASVALENFATHYPVVQCCGCSLVYVPLEFSADQLQDYYQNAHSVRMINEFYAARQAGNVVASHRLAQVAALLPKDNRVIRVLEIGCNNGEFLHQLRQANPDKKFELHGIDPNSDNVASAVQKGVMVHQGLADQDSAAAYFAEQRYDLVLCFELIEHLNHPGVLLRKIHQSLTDAGKLLISTPNFEGLACMLAGYNQNFPLAHAISPPAHIQGFSRVSLGILANRLGYKIARIDATGAFDQYAFMYMAEKGMLAEPLAACFDDIYQEAASWDTLSAGLQRLLNVLHSNSSLTAVFVK